MEPRLSRPHWNRTVECWAADRWKLVMCRCQRVALKNLVTRRRCLVSVGTRHSASHSLLLGRRHRQTLGTADLHVMSQQFHHWRQ